MRSAFTPTKSLIVLSLTYLASTFGCSSNGNASAKDSENEGGSGGDSSGSTSSNLGSSNSVEGKKSTNRPRGTGGSSSSSTHGSGGTAIANSSSNKAGSSGVGGFTANGGSNSGTSTGKGGSTSSGGTVNTGGSTSIKSAGCGKNPPYTGAQTLKINVAGKSRDYLLNVPDPYNASKPYAVVFGFHGANSGAGPSELLNTSTAAQNAIFVSPQGLPYSLNGTNYGVGWDESCTGIDVQLVDALLEQLKKDFCVAPNRVFAHGISWGGDFTNALGCCRGDVFRALAPASGAEWGNELGFNLDCGTRPLPAYRITYGDKDDGYTQLAFVDVVKTYRTGNHCKTTFTATSPSPCVAYDGCDHPVIECKYAGMGHTYPPNWQVGTWDFFASFQ
jgi:poly(3-hydroxybutyrate) depolymerase